MVTSVINFTTFNIPQDFFEGIVKKVLESEGKKELVVSVPNQDLLVEVVLLGQGRMRNINKRYKGKNQVTEVLSFPDKEVKKTTKKDLKFIEAPEAQNLLGEILLCPAKIKKDAKKFKKSFEEELTFVFVHGLLHLLGYDHKDTKTTQKMRKKEKEILKKVLCRLERIDKNLNKEDNE